MRLCLLLATILITGAVLAKPLPGPFVVNDAVTFHLLNPTGQAFAATLRWRDGFRVDQDRWLLVRVFDPEEKLLLRQEIAAPADAKVPTEEIRLTVPASGTGVYQIKVVGGGSVYYKPNTVELQTTPELEFGVFGGRQAVTGRKDQFADTYVYLPPGLKQLPVRVSGQGTQFGLLDEQGQSKLQLDEKTPGGAVDLPAGEHVWRLQASGKDYFALEFNGLPMVLCPSPEVARAIHASVDVMPDGTLCFFKHQAVAWKLLQEYKRRPASDYDVPVEPLEKYRDAYLKDPARNQLLFGYYGVMSVLPPILASQCLDPQSRWFGSIREWQDKNGQPRTDNPFADYNRLGLEEFAATNKDLAALYWLKADFNPYYHNPHLLNRVIIAVLLDQLVMKEDEYVSRDSIYYGGIQAFTITHSHSGAFSLVYPDVPPAVQAIWQAGQQRLTDRFLYTTVGGCTNQWSILLVGLWRYVQGTGDPVRREALLRNLQWLLDFKAGGQAPAGYMTEASGPDATYNGITGHCLAELWSDTKSPAVLEGLRKCYNLFNHTVTPEPDGRVLGSSGYCHRTPGDWTSPQYGAGLGVMAKVLPEAGVRYPNWVPWAHPAPVTDEASRQKAVEDLDKAMKYLPDNWFASEPANTGRASGAFDIGFANWRNFSEKMVPGKLPMVAEDRFARDFGREFFCVRRPAYYTFLYGGQAYGEWQSGSRPKVYHEQFPANDGLCLFWSPAFGTSLLTKNWGAGQTNTLLADRGEGKVDWPWYWSVKSEFDTDAGTAKLTGKFKDLPLSYERVYRFLDDRVQCSLTVTAAQALKLAALSECLPYPLAGIKPDMKVSLLDAGGKVVENGQPCQTIVFSNAGAQHRVQFAVPTVVSLGEDKSEDHYGGKHTYGRALVALPAEWAPGQTFTLTYEFVPTAAQ